MQRKKKQSRDLHNHTCVLKKLNGCKQFTAKATNKKYVEIHHIIPQEFRNEFENSIEVFANYADPKTLYLLALPSPILANFFIPANFFILASTVLDEN